MALFEKIFQRNDKFFLQIYFILQGAFFYLNSSYMYYLRNGTFVLESDYFTGTILIVITFWFSAIIKLKEYRYLVGTTQFAKIELILLIQTFIIVIVLTVMFKLTANYSRAWFFSTFATSFFSLVFLKIIFDIIYQNLIGSNIIQRNILLVGDSINCENIIKRFPKKKSNSVIKCLLTIDKSDGPEYYSGLQRFNWNDDMDYILRHHSIGQVWIISSFKTHPYTEKIIDRFLNFPVDCRLISTESKFKFIEGLDSEGGYNFYNISFSPFYGTSLLIKNLLDKLLALFFLFIGLPLIIIASLLIILQDGFPIIFKQKRTGWDGNSFYIYKLRTLYNAKKSSNEKQVESGDKRVTPIGSILRRLSIDELPQLINVLKGEMAIVGPRPHMTEHTEHYSGEVINFMQRHKCSPGLTGWAQIHGFRGPTRRKDEMDKRFQYDLYYIKNWSLMLDFYIILRTFLVILFQKVD